jgi:hypothetical protein
MASLRRSLERTEKAREAGPHASPEFYGAPPLGVDVSCPERAVGVGGATIHLCHHTSDHIRLVWPP